MTNNENWRALEREIYGRPGCACVWAVMVVLAMIVLVGLGIAWMWLVH